MVGCWGRRFWWQGAWSIGKRWLTSWLTWSCCWLAGGCSRIPYLRWTSVQNVETYCCGCRGADEADAASDDVFGDMLAVGIAGIAERYAAEVGLSRAGR